MFKKKEYRTLSAFEGLIESTREETLVYPNTYMDDKGKTIPHPNAGESYQVTIRTMKPEESPDRTCEAWKHVAGSQSH